MLKEKPHVRDFHKAEKKNLKLKASIKASDKYLRSGQAPEGMGGAKRGEKWQLPSFSFTGSGAGQPGSALFLYLP